MIPRYVEILTYTCRMSHSDHWKTVMVPLGNTVIALSNLEDLKKRDEFAYLSSCHDCKRR